MGLLVTSQLYFIFSIVEVWQELIFIPIKWGMKGCDLRRFNKKIEFCISGVLFDFVDLVSYSFRGGFSCENFSFGSCFGSAQQDFHFQSALRLSRGRSVEACWLKRAAVLSWFRVEILRSILLLFGAVAWARMLNPRDLFPRELFSWVLHQASGKELSFSVWLICALSREVLRQPAATAGQDFLFRAVFSCRSDLGHGLISAAVVGLFFVLASIMPRAGRSGRFPVSLYEHTPGLRSASIRSLLVSPVRSVLRLPPLFFRPVASSACCCVRPRPQFAGSCFDL
jgi:hypothetical protein